MRNKKRGRMPAATKQQSGPNATPPTVFDAQRELIKAMLGAASDKIGSCMSEAAAVVGKGNFNAVVTSMDGVIKAAQAVKYEASRFHEANEPEDDYEPRLVGDDDDDEESA